MRGSPEGEQVRTKRIADPASPGDGARILVMRLWPRGTRKTVSAYWLKGLGTPRELIREWKAGKIGWKAFANAYQRHLRTAEAQTDMQTLISLARQGPVTLLCTCHEETHCHRGILKRVLHERLRRGDAGRVRQ